jgi:Spy/CpxP family protein refolding chaperone
MNKILTSITFGVLSLTLPAFSAFSAEETKPAAPAAQQPADPARMIESRIEMMKEALSLTPEQVAKIRPLMERDGEKLKAIIGDASLSQEDRRAKVREVMQASGESINGVLTPEQREKWKAQAEKRRAEAQKRREQGGNQ